MPTTQQQTSTPGLADAVSETWASHVEGPGRFARLYLSLRWGVHSTPNPAAEALAGELGQLRDAGFRRVAEIVESSTTVPVVPRPEGHLFDLGQVEVSRQGATILELTSDEIDGMLARHATGDAGELGTGWPSLDITIDQARLNDRHSPSVQNKATLASGRGLIRSRYPAYRLGVDNVPPHDPWQPRRRRNAGEWVEIMSLIGAGGPRTIVYTSLDMGSPS